MLSTRLAQRRKILWFCSLRRRGRLLSPLLFSCRQLAGELMDHPRHVIGGHPDLLHKECVDLSSHQEDHGEVGVCGWEEQQLGRRIRTNGLSKRSKASQPSIFGVLGRMNRPQLSYFCPHLFRPFLISKLRRSHCSALPVSEEVFADKKPLFSLL